MPSNRAAESAESNILSMDDTSTPNRLCSMSAALSFPNDNPETAVAEGVGLEGITLGRP